MKKILISLLLGLVSIGVEAQVITHVDTIECSIIGFRVGAVAPSSAFSYCKTPSGDKDTIGTMADLYKAPYINFGVDYKYKFLSNWLISATGDFYFGNDNLTQQQDRMGIWSSDPTPIIIGTNGTDANITCYNRGIALQIGVGKIFAFSDKNPNSGLIARMGGGWQQNHTVFTLHDVHAPQIEGDYARLYDHQRRGAILTESIGYIFMSNHRNLMNASIEFEISQFWSHSTRDYMIDHVMGLQGPDNNRYFDLLYSIKLTWMFPLTGRPTYDYFYY